MKKTLFVFILLISFTYYSQAVFVTLANAPVLTKLLTALGDPDIIGIVEETDLIEQLANQSKNTSEIVECVRQAIVNYMGARRVNTGMIVKITKSLINHDPEACAEFDRYYKLNSNF